MALRKFSKYMKFVTILVIISVLLSAAYAGYSYITSYLNTKKHVMLTVGGVKIYKEDYEKEYSNLEKSIKELYARYSKGEETLEVPENIKKELVLLSLIKKEEFKILAKELKVEVSSKDVNEELSKIENNYGNRETLALLLAQQNLTIKDLKEDIKGELLKSRIIDKFKQQLTVNDEILEKIYSLYKYSEFESREFDEVREDVLALYHTQNLDFIISSRFEEIFDKLTIDTKDEEIKNAFENLKKVEVELEDIKILRKDLIIEYLLHSAKVNVYDENTEKEVRDTKLEELKILKEKEAKILSLGIKAEDNLTPINKISNLMQKYFYHLVETSKFTEEEIREWFRVRKEQLNTQNTVSGEVFGITYSSTDEKDYKLSEEKAKEVLSTITKENFAEKAKELSKDTASAVNGGSLGEVDLRHLVKEFSVVKNAEEGSIIGPVKSKFGYHIIYVEEKNKEDENKAKLSHILLSFEISEETKTKLQNEVLDIEKQIKESKLTWEQIASDTTGKYDKFDIKEQFSKITKNSALPKVGYNEKLMEELFNIEVNGILVKNLGDAFVIIQKTQEIPFKEAVYEDYREQLRIELGFLYARQEIAK